MGSSYINRFIQPDTLIPDPSNPQAWNRYAYVLNNPIRFNDPTGHESGDYCDRGYCEYDETFVIAGIYQQSGGWYGLNERQRGPWIGAKMVREWLTGEEADILNTGIGSAKVTDAQMEAPLGYPVSGDVNDPRGYGLGLRDPGSITPDQNDYGVAKIAMGRRIGLRLDACTVVECSKTDRVIVAALAANEDISPAEVIRIFNKDSYRNKDGTFNWDDYLEIDRKDNAPRIRNTIISQFLDGIDSKYKQRTKKTIKWDYIERLTR